MLHNISNLLRIERSAFLKHALSGWSVLVDHKIGAFRKQGGFQRNQWYGLIPMTMNSIKKRNRRSSSRIAKNEICPGLLTTKNSWFENYATFQQIYLEFFLWQRIVDPVSFTQHS
jgi:hypothetical protein